MKHYHNNEYDIIQDNQGNKIATIKGQSKKDPDIYLIWSHDRCEFNELDSKEPEQGVVRAYAITSSGCKIQFRATQPLKRGQKERNLIATAHFSKEDLQYILNQMK